MEIKIFGKSLFSIGEAKKDFILNAAVAEIKTSKYLMDFHKMREHSNSSPWVIESTAGMLTATNPDALKKEDKNTKKKEDKKKLTPKDVYTLKMLNNKSFKLNTNEKYVDEQIATFKDKLALVKAEEYDMSRGVNEVSSVLERMENRKKYDTVKDYFEQFPYTMSTQVDALLKNHDYLQLGQVAQFVADLPKEAVEVMKEYSAKTEELCGKKAVFYIIADKKDFKKSEQRRDPILLAQSPFGHFWQICGAWDKEMLLVEEL